MTKYFGNLEYWQHEQDAGIFPQGTSAVYFESSGVIITLILLGRWLEARASGQTGAAIQKLIALDVEFATKRADGQFKMVPVEDIKVGDVLLANSGERIALHGTVIEGHSYVDESMVTSELMPLIRPCTPHW